jgi:hypothetical protein
MLGPELPTVYYDGSEEPLPKPSFDGRDEQFVEEGVVEYINLLKELVRRSDGRRMDCLYRYDNISNTNLQILLAISRATRVDLKFSSFPVAYEVKVILGPRGNAGGRLWGDSFEIRFIGKHLLPGYPDPDSMVMANPFTGYSELVS